LNCIEKTTRIFFIILEFLLIFGIIFVLICSLALLSDSLRILGGGSTGIFNKISKIRDVLIILFLKRVILENSLANSTFIRNPISASIGGIAVSSILMGGNALVSLLIGMISAGCKF
jgi:hypothetical protein